MQFHVYFFLRDDDELKEAKMATEENLILDGLTEVVTALTHVLTADQLAEFWSVIFPKTKRYLDPKRSHVEYSLGNFFIRTKRNIS